MTSRYVNNGVPGPGARPNDVKGLGEINRGRQPNVANLRPDLPQVVATLDLAGLSQPITSSPPFTPYEDGLYRGRDLRRHHLSGGRRRSREPLGRPEHSAAPTYGLTMSTERVG